MTQIEAIDVPLDMDKAIFDRSWNYLESRREQRDRGHYMRRIETTDEGLFKQTDFYLTERKQEASIQTFQDRLLTIPHGIYREFTSSGRLTVSGQYTDGAKSGSWIYYWRNGNKFLEGDYKDDKREGAWIRYDKGESKIWEAVYIAGVKHGVETTWREDGSELMKTNYRLGRLQGPLRSYHPNGQVARDELYKDGERLNATCYDENGNEIAYYPHIMGPVLQDCEEREEGLLPEDGCSMQQIMTEIAENVEYPERERTLGKEGIVEVSFFVTSEGRITDITLLEEVSKPMGYQCTRIVRRFQRWIPGTIDGEPADFHVVLPVTFMLN